MGLSLRDAVGLLSATPALRGACPVQMPVMADGTPNGAWQVCCALAFPPPPEPCLAVSVGIGNDWLFEHHLDSAGCEVHAFDPTQSLRAGHAAYAAMPESRHIRFYYLGLAPSAQVVNLTRQPYGALDLARMASLERILDLATAGRESPRIDVLKIDCEGCEWAVFEELASRQSSLLSNVRTLMIELHVTSALGLRNASQFTTLIDHVVRVHGFQLYKRKFNHGMSKDRRQALPELQAAGFPGSPCCVELHFVRPADVIGSGYASPHAPPSSASDGRRLRAHSDPHSNPSPENSQQHGAAQPTPQQGTSPPPGACNFRPDDGGADARRYAGVVAKVRRDMAEWEVKGPLSGATLREEGPSAGTDRRGAKLEAKMHRKVKQAQQALAGAAAGAAAIAAADT